jgi:hypothetical protein
MFAIIYTTTRPDTNTAWIQTSITDKSNYTDDEYNNVVLPYWQWVQSLTGFQSVEITFPDDLTKVTTHTFDTEINAREAFNLMSGKLKKDEVEDPSNPDQHDLAKAKMLLSHSKMSPNRIGTVEIKEV